MSSARITDKRNLLPLAHGALNRCFGCGLENRSGLRLKFFIDDHQNIVCHTRLARRFEGPPGHAHGGIIATLLDEAMSKSNRARGVLAMTRHMAVDYVRPVPLGVPLTIIGRHAGESGRKHHCEAQIADASGQILASAKALFIEVTPDMIQAYEQSLLK